VSVRLNPHGGSFVDRGMSAEISPCTRRGGIANEPQHHVAQHLSLLTTPRRGWELHRTARLEQGPKVTCRAGERRGRRDSNASGLSAPAIEDRVSHPGIAGGGSSADEAAP